MSEESLKKLEEQHDQNAVAIRATHLMTIKVSEKPDGELELDCDLGESVGMEMASERLAKVAAAFIALANNKDVFAKYVENVAHRVKYQDRAK